MSAPPAARRDPRTLVDIRPEAGVCRVERDVYLDPAIFALEMARIFEGTWVFIALAGELGRAHDFVTRRIGRQPVLVTRDGDGRLRAFLNSCRHRGTLLCPFAAGNRRFHVCRYHGWTYDSAGRAVEVTDLEHGQYPPGFAAADHGLVPVPRVEAYRDFVFASLNPDVPPLAEHLGEAKLMLDLVADQAPRGLEFVPGRASYIFEGNWKLQFENGLDAYHFPATHAAFIDIVRRRPRRHPPPWARGFVPDEGRVAAGTIGFPRGHALSWSLGAPGQGPEDRPLPRDRELFETVRRQVGDRRMGWMLRQRNLTIFPNMQLIDIQSLQLRTWEPLAVDRTRMHSHCLAPVGEAPEARRFRIRQYEAFFNASGLATSDDNVIYERSQAGLAATAAGPGQAFLRGLAPAPVPGEAYAALGLETARCTFSDQGLAFGDESGIHAGYREWLRLMTAGDGGEVAS